jgi:hypothetical protein
MSTPQTDTPHPQAPDFGEPWRLREANSRTVTIAPGALGADFDLPEHAARAIACTNALRGVPDPAEFVRQAKENAEILKRLGHH